MNHLVKSCEPSLLNLWLCTLGGLALALGSVALVFLGETQLAIWLVLLGILTFLVESHCTALAAAIKKQGDMANRSQNVF